MWSKFHPVDTIQSLCFLMFFPWLRPGFITKAAIKSRIPSGKVEIIPSKFLRSPSGWPMWNICLTDNGEYTWIVVTTIPSVSLYETYDRNLYFISNTTCEACNAESSTLPQHLRSSPVVGGTGIVWSLVFYVLMSNVIYSFRCDFILSSTFELKGPLIFSATRRRIKIKFCTQWLLLLNLNVRSHN